MRQEKETRKERKENIRILCGKVSRWPGDFVCGCVHEEYLVHRYCESACLIEDKNRQWSSVHFVGLFWCLRLVERRGVGW